MPSFLLDTTILIDLLRGRSSAQEYINTLSEKPLLSSLTVAEVYAGMRHQREILLFEALLKDRVVVPINTQIAREGGQYRQQYHPSHGTGIIDALIAATAEKKGAILVTHNKKHFPMLNNVVVPY